MRYIKNGRFLIGSILIIIEILILRGRLLMILFLVISMIQLNIRIQSSIMEHYFLELKVKFKDGSLVCRY